MIVAITGFIAGSIHVWAGPDHLSAIAPLAVRWGKRSWLTGIRWGLGHSTGVLLVGLLSLWLRGVLPVEWLSHSGERLVGVMLIGIGLWGFKTVLHTRIHAHSHMHDGEGHAHYHFHADSTKHSGASTHRHLHVAFGIGVLHGLAGSSHFLGVLPALALPTFSQAAYYILAFGLGTIFSMAFFAAVLGQLGQRFGSKNFQALRVLQSICASAAIVVGCFWLVL